MVKVSLHLGKTYNLGNYESLRIDVGLEKDVPEITQEEKDKIYEEVLNFITETAKKTGVKE